MCHSQSVAPDGRKQRGLYGRLADENAVEAQRGLK